MPNADASAMIVREVLTQAAEVLGNDEATLEAQVLLESVLAVNHAWLLAHADDTIDEASYQAFQSHIARRVKGEPIAYILGQREFYGLPLTVSEDTLIPRPDTETLVDVALESLDKRLGLNTLGYVEMDTLPDNDKPISVLDLGTGTGAIALAIAHSLPILEVTAVDASANALKVAQNNAEKLNIENVTFVQSDWFSSLLGQTFDFIVSNPPYIEESDQHLNQGDLRFEPLSALASGQDGLDDIRRILLDCLVFLKPQGWVMLEHGYQQADAVQDLMAETGLVDIATFQDLGGNDRVTVGKNPLILSQHWSI